MKISDDEFDENSNQKLAIFFGIVTGVLSGILISINSDAAYILIAIILGNILASKIDGIHHIISTVSFLIISILTIVLLSILAPSIIPINYLVNFSIITLIICTLAAFIDDWGHDNPIFNKNKALKTFFKYRLFMKIVILVLAIGSITELAFGFSIPFVSFLDFSTFVYFILFEIGYIFAELIFKRFLLN